MKTTSFLAHFAAQPTLGHFYNMFDVKLNSTQKSFQTWIRFFSYFIFIYLLFFQYFDISSSFAVNRRLVFFATIRYFAKIRGFYFLFTVCRFRYQAVSNAGIQGHCPQDICCFCVHKIVSLFYVLTQQRSSEA